MIDIFNLIKQNQRDRLEEQYRRLLESECVITDPSEWDDIDNVEVIDIDPEAAE